MGKQTTKKRKITVVLPEDVIERALESSGDSLAGTIRQGLEIIAARSAYEKLSNLRGKVKISLDLKQLRAD